MSRTETKWTAEEKRPRKAHDIGESNRRRLLAAIGG